MRSLGEVGRKLDRPSRNDSCLIGDFLEICFEVNGVMLLDLKVKEEGEGAQRQHSMGI